MTKFTLVFGDGEDTGKTSVVEALVKGLNQCGTPATGFKPISFSTIDRIKSLSASVWQSNPAIAGNDAFKHASLLEPDTPITPEILSPICLSGKDRHRNFLFFRAGFLGSKSGRSVAGCRGAQKYLLKNGCSAAVAERFSGLEVISVPNGMELFLHPFTYFGRKHQEEAIQAVKDAGISHIVVEGAGKWIPPLTSGTVFQNIVFLSNFHAKIWRGIDLFVGPTLGTTPTFDTLISRLPECDICLNLYCQDEDLRERVNFDKLYGSAKHISELQSA